KRKAIAVQTASFVFVGPENGVLSWALSREKVKEVRALENQNYFLQPVSRTFHGRDIFAPVAAHLSRGVPLRKLGPALRDFVGLAWPSPRRTKREVIGEVVYVDRFGNAITNIEATAVRGLGNGEGEVFAGRKRLGKLASHYEAVPKGNALAVVG